MTKWTNRHGPLAARALLALIFLLSGLQKSFNFSQIQDLMASAGLVPARALLVFAIVIELFGGLSLLAGYLTRIGALLLTLYLVPVTFAFHGFWNYAGLEYQQQLIHFMKNLAIMGGLLAVTLRGAGELSFDARYPHEARLFGRLSRLTQRPLARRVRS